MRVLSLRGLVAPAASLLLAATLVTALPTGPAAQAAPGDPLGPLFEPLEDFRLPGEDARVRPEEFAAFDVDLAALGERLATAPTAGEARRGSDPTVVFVPDPDGGLVRFAVTETAVMEPGLAARHPELRTYAGRGLDDPRLSVALDVTPMGFHASVRQAGAHESWLVDPVRNERGTTEHVAYHGHDVAAPSQPFDFNAPLPELGVGEERRRAVARPGAGEAVPLRTYRLALITDPSYAAYFGTDNVLAEKVTLINRVNQVYLDDLAIRMLLVDGTDRLNLDTAAEAIGPDGPCGANGCYTTPQLAGCSSGLLTRNTFVLGQLIGADRYDVGHIALGLNGGGIAGLGVVGEERKAAGCTGLPRPQGDFFAIDYVAHELGHQFNGNHTFDGNQGNCSLTNRNPGTSVEPGSGSSVMAYAGICAQDDLQPHTDPYFSQRSLDEVDAHVTAEPTSYSEEQVVTLRGFDTDGDLVNLTYRGRTTTVERGLLTYNPLVVQQRLSALTGESVTVSGYDGGSAPSDAGFTVTWNDSAAHERIGVLGTQDEGGAPVTASVGVLVDGGPGTNQGATSATGNRAPGVTAPADRTIPRRTPFTLTGGGTDADGDALVYLWEQDDEGAGQTEGTALTSNVKTSGPLFRVFGTAAEVSDEAALQSPSPGQNTAGGSPSRTFPDLAQVLADRTNAETGQCPAAPADPEAPVPPDVVECYSEFLPTADYTGGGTLGEPATMTFRLTARDQRPGGGGTGFDDVTLTLADAGPFQVTSQATAGPLRQAGSTETVAWAVNGTAAPELAPQVRITMSDDGGATFDHVLAETTPNDGSHEITWPDVVSDEVRLRVEAVDNYFFDVNDAVLSLTAPLSAETASTGAAAAFSDGLDAPVEVIATSGEVDADQLEAVVAGVRGLQVERVSATEDGERPAVATFALTGPVLADPGSYVATVTVSEPQPDGAADAVQVPVTVRPEGAGLAFTGPETTAPGATTLSASVTDLADGSPGDVRRSRLTFVDRSTGQPLCGPADVVGTAAEGTASCEATLAASTVVGLVLDGAHARDDRDDDTTVTVVAGDTTAPQTRITAGPAEGALLASAVARLRYTADERAWGYACRLDGVAVACGDGAVRLRGLRGGQHTFSVAARDAAGNLDPTPAVRRFSVALDDRQVQRSRGWREQAATGHFRRTFVTSTRRGATASLPLDGATRVGVVVATGPGAGTLVVTAGGRTLGRVVTSGESRKRVVRTFTLPARTSGALVVRTLDRRPVRLDGLAAFGG